MRNKLFLTGLLAGAFIAAPLPAFAQSNEIINRLNRIENEIDTLNRAVYKGEAPPRASAPIDAANQANLEVRLQQMETQLRDLTGTLEQQNYDIQQVRERLDALDRDTQLRIEALDAQRGPAVQTTPFHAQGGSATYGDRPYYNSQQAEPAAGPSDYGYMPMVGQGQTAPGMRNATPAAQAMPGDAGAQYERAFALVGSGNYSAAEGALEDFLRDNPDHELAPNATYWLGETYYVRGNYEQAAKVFADAYQKYPNASKSADSLLKLGMSLSGMGRKDDACIALRQLIKNYPQGSGPVLRRGEQEMTSLGC